MGAHKLSVVAVDGDRPALAALAAMLTRDPRVGPVETAGDAVAALRLVRQQPVDVVFLDVAGDPSGRDMTGLELGSLLIRLSAAPALVFVADTGAHALDSYEVGALDYLVRPVRPERLARSLGRVSAWRGLAEHGGDLAALPVEVDGRTVLVHREDVRFVEARGDYVRLHTDTGVHLVRIPLSRLTLHWARSGFVRVHRGYLVSLRHVRELREDPLGGVLVSVVAGGTTRELPVSRRHVRTVKDRLTGAARPR